MDSLKKIGYFILLGIVLYFLSSYLIKLLGVIINIAIMIALVLAAYWLYKKIENDD